ncbi:MAG: hypothetical protein LBF26_03170 [Puniceicoccales bacterium]|jgi:hypothetical protein|nr:hypothetical protein [Puniceicoccales bacterium]
MCGDRALAAMSGYDTVLNQAREEMRVCRDDPEQLGYWRDMYSCAMRMKGRLALVVVAFNVDAPSLRACATLFYTLTTTEKSDPLYGQVVRDLAQAMRDFSSEMTKMSLSTTQKADGEARKAAAEARKTEAEAALAEELRLSEERVEDARQQARVTAAHAEEAEARARQAMTQAEADNDPELIAARREAAMAEKELKAQEVRRAKLENKKREEDMRSWREKHCSVA